MDAMKMRPSRVLRKLRAGEVVICTKVNLADPRVSEIVGLCGFDCIWLDMEHIPNTLEHIENHIRAAKANDVDTMVRVKRGGYSNLICPLEMDAAGIMVPHVMSLADAKQIVYYTRFHPIGRRPVDGGSSDGAYCMIAFDQYIKQANQQRFVVVQIEDPEPLEDLEQIAQLDGVDMLFFGPADFTQGIGKPGDFTNPKVQETRRQIGEVARKYGKFAGTTGNLENFESLVEMGYQFISVGADVVSLGESFNSIISALGKTAYKSSNSIYSDKAK